MTEKKINIGIAWSNTQDSYTFVGTKIAAEETGENVVLLDMVKSEELEYENNLLVNGKDSDGVLSVDAARTIKKRNWKKSNAEEVLSGIDCVIFPGGWDISPSLLKNEQPWHSLEGDLEVCAERDVSDYLLLSCCLEKNIPILCICRGMQLLAIAEGGDIIQDLPTYFNEINVEYDYLHRDSKKKLFIAHPVNAEKDSLIYSIMGSDVIEGCPSWHHQIVRDVSDTKLTVTGTTDTNGLSIIEVIERQDLKFCIGVQYHPEVSVRTVLKGEHQGDNLMSYEDAMLIFNALVSASKN